MWKRWKISVYEKGKEPRKNLVATSHLFEELENLNSIRQAEGHSQVGDKFQPTAETLNNITF